jgi:GT2 family glycosyltransferase
LLVSLLAAESPGPYEVIIADQSPVDRAARILSGLDTSRVRGLRSPRGKSAGLNHALREARGEVFATLDDDVTVPGDSFTTLRRLVAEEPFDLLWGTVEPARPPSPDEWLPVLEGLRPDRFKGLARGGRMPGSGANLTLRTQALRDLGGFDEALCPSGICDCGEDRDIASRAAHAGLWSRIAPELTVVHWNARRYSDGSAAELNRVYQRGLGAFWMKQLRLGDWPLARLYGRRLLWVRPWRHRAHRASIRAFVSGAWTAARIPLDRKARLLKPCPPEPAATASTSTPAARRSGR